MRPERAGQKLPCRECGSMIQVPGRASGASVTPMMAIIGGSAVIIVLVVAVVALAGFRRDRNSTAGSDAIVSTPGTGDVESSPVPAPAAGSPSQDPLVAAGSANTGRTNALPAPAMPAAAMPSMSQEQRLYEEHRRRLAAQGIEVPEFSELVGSGANGSAPGPNPAGPSAAANSVSGREPAPNVVPGFRRENEKIRSRMQDWKPCIDPIPPNFLPVWEPAKTNKQETRDSGRVDAVLAGSGSPYLAMETETFGEEWTVFDIRSKRPYGLAFAGRGSSSARVLRRDGKYFATEHEGGVRVSDVRDKQILGTISGNLDHRCRIAFLGTDRLAVCGEKQLQVWTIPQGEMVKQISLPDAINRTIAFSAGGKYGATFAGERGTSVVRLIDLTTGDDAGLLYGSPEANWATSSALGFSDDGLEFAAFIGGQMIVWDLQTGDAIEKFDLGDNAPERHGFDAGELQWFPNKQRWLVNASVVIDRQSQSILFRLEQNGLWTSPATVASDNHLIALNSDTRFHGFAVADLTGPPFSSPGAGSEGSAIAGAVLSLPLVKEPDWATVLTLEPAVETPAWEVVPDPSTEPAEPMQVSIGIPLREDRLKDLRFSGHQAASVALAYDVQSSGSGAKRDNSKCRVEVFSLTSGRRTSQLKLIDAAELMALSPSGKRVLMRAESGSGRVDVWDMEQRAHVAGWKPTKSHFGSEMAAMFADESHVFTMDSEKLVLWELPACKAVYQIENAKGPGVSPTGRYLAVRTGNVYMMLEALTGKAVGRLTTDDQITAASFHPNGDLFAAVTQVGGYFDTKFADLILWNMKSGERVAHVPLQYAGSTMHWCGDSHVLIDNTILVDIVRQVPVWTYSIRNGLHCMLSPDDRHWYLTRPDREGRAELKLRSVQLPEPDVTTRTVGKMGADLIAVKPGTAVACLFQADQRPLTPAIEKSILDSVRVELVRNGMVPVDQSPFQIVLSIHEQETGEQVTYHESPSSFGFGGFGGFGGRRSGQSAASTGTQESIQGRKVECRVRVAHDGKTLWQSSQSFDNAFFLSVQSGQSLSDAVRERLWESGVRYFSELRLPRYVYDAGEGFGFGQTLLTYDGPLTIGGDPIRPDKDRGYGEIPDADFSRALLGQ